MSWVSDEIERYERAELNFNKLGDPIPSELQVGKILQRCKGDVSKARYYIDSQIRMDEESNLEWEVANNGLWPADYWKQVKKRFEALLEQDINRVIMET